jgi:hypothetical protein
MLPVNGSLDTGGIGRVGFVSICGFFKESVVCAVDQWLYYIPACLTSTALE